MSPTAGGSGKRKRNDRTYSQDDVSRPSPHRPDTLDLARSSQPLSPSQEDRDGQAIGRSVGRGRNGAKDSTPSDTEIPSQTQQLRAADVDMNVESADADGSTETQIRPYHYNYLTDAIVSSWSEQGKDVVKAQFLDCLEGADHLGLDILMQEIVEAGTTGKIKVREVGEFLKDVFTVEETSSILQEAFLGAVSTLFTDDTPNPNLESLSEMIVFSELNEAVLRQELDGKLLEQLGLIRSTFYRVGIRKQTNVLYRQANFNLMREESEGFAKLMTELFSTPGHESANNEVVENMVEKVKAMIGAFDLDVGRSLDVVLDVFGSVLVRQYRFFVKFLRASPWWPTEEDADQSTDEFLVGGLPEWAIPGALDWHERSKDSIRARDTTFWSEAREEGLRAFFRLGHIRASEQAQDEEEVMDGDLRQQWIRETGTLPSNGNRDAAQLLGFKLRYYAPSSVRDAGDDLPKNLIYLSALLIKIGFISLHDLYPHIWRPDEEMDDLKQSKVKEKAERERAARPGAGAKNALLMAGALADDTLPLPPRLRETNTRSNTPAKDSEEKSTTKDHPDATDQKILLLQSLLAIGAMPEALFILGRFPWMTDLVPEMPAHINRIIHHCLSDLYDRLRPLQDRSSLQLPQPLYKTDLPGLPPGQARLEEPSQRKVLRWPQLDKDDFEPDGVSYRFYWDEWNDNVPICQNIEDFFTLSRTLLPLVGAKIGQDPCLVLKIARIGKHSLEQDPSDLNKNRWLDLCKRVLLPSLSLTKANPGVVNEVFELISRFPTSSRYLMYLEWLNGRVSKSPDMKVAFDQARAETRDILKRISKTNVRPMARALARIAYANPHIVITTALTQIEVYDSIADVFVEGARYFTDLGYDVLTWALISSMARAGRSRVQEGGIFTSRWLTALAHFAGKIYKRYNLMKPGPVLQYVSEQLEKGSATDLIMLEQIVVSMAGIAPDTNFNDAQLQAMGGGPLLQSQTILQLLDQRHNSKASSKRLVKALQDHGLTSKLLLCMSQQREDCIFEEGDVPLKAVGNVFDEISRVLGQYLDLLRANFSAEEFEITVPNVATMLNEYNIPPEIAFWISRPVIARQITEFDKDKPTKQADGDDVDMADQQESDEEDGEAAEDEVEDVTAVANASTPTETQLNGDMDEQDADVVIEENWHPVLKSVMDGIRERLPVEVADLIGVGFFVTFWQLSLYEISVPGKSYEDEMSRQKRKIAGITADRSNVSVSGSKAKEAQIKQLQHIINELLAENKQHLKSYSESRARLQREKDQWFAAKARLSTELNIALMEHCFLPRMLASPLDAYFCFKFAKFLHSTGTPNFRTLGFYDQFFKSERLAALIFTCTSKESDNLGRFLNEVLRDLGRWHQSKSTYEREAFGSKRNLPGFALKVENGKPQLLLDYESFRRILFKWHSNLYSALIKCLTSTEYMHVRNAISVLRTVSATYPAVDFHGKALQKSVDKLRESDKEDLKVASQALLGALHRREKQWIVPQAFRQGQDSVVTQEKAATPQPPMEEKKTEEPVEEVKMADAPPVSKLENDTEQTQSRGPIVRQEPERRPARPAEFKPSHHLPRKLSPPARYQSTTLPSRPEGDPRNGYRTRPTEPPRPDSRSGHGRHGPPMDRNHEPPPYDQPRYPRPPDRDERPPPRREYPVERHERDHRLEREPRPEREYPRPPDYSDSHRLPDRRSDRQPIEETRPGISIRGQAHQEKRPSSRPVSPKREEERRHTGRETLGRPFGTMPPSPAGPRNPARPPNRGPVDMQHGRLEQEPSHRPAPARNEREREPEPVTRPPSREEPSRPPPPREESSRPAPRNEREAEPPSGPRNRPPRPNQPPASRPGPRQTRSSSISEAPADPAVHPDRMNQITATEPRSQRPPPLQTSPPAGPRNGPPPTAPSGPSPVSRGPPPSGPADADRGRRHPMAAVNNTLAQAAQGPSGRGRGGMRQNSASFSRSDFNPDSAPPNPNAMPIQPRQQRSDGSRPDVKDDRPPRREDGPRNEAVRGYRSGPADSTRKHPRDDSHYNSGPPRGGSRAGDLKKPRRGRP